MSGLTRRSDRWHFVFDLLVRGGEAQIRGYDPDRGQHVVSGGEPGGSEQLEYVQIRLVT